MYVFSTQEQIYVRSKAIQSHLVQPTQLNNKNQHKNILNHEIDEEENVR